MCSVSIPFEEFVFVSFSVGWLVEFNCSGGMLFEGANEFGLVVVAAGGIGLL